MGDRAMTPACRNLILPSIPMQRLPLCGLYAAVSVIYSQGWLSASILLINYIVSSAVNLICTLAVVHSVVASTFQLDADRVKCTI